jgi:hypothetical protein
MLTQTGEREIMKIVLNKCYGGFGLSPKAIKRIADLQGRECYFFANKFSPERYVSITMEQAEKDGLFFSVFSIPNPGEFLRRDKEWHEMTSAECQAWNEKYRSVSLKSYSYEERGDPLLIQVLEELGEAASGKLAELEIVEIPDGIEWDIDDYDGIETAHEKHMSW